MRKFRLLPADSPVGWLPYTWLVYLSLFVVYAFMGHTSAVRWVVYAAALLAFLVLYFRGFWVEGRASIPILCGILAIGVLLSPVNPGASVFFVYAAAFAADVGPPGVALRWIGVIILVLASETLVVGLRPEAWIPGGFISLIVGGGNIYFVEKYRAQRRLRLAQAEVEHLAKVAERERIARDLHDLLGHTLSVIVLKSELAAKLAERDPVRATAEIRDVERISREALGEVRRAVQGYRDLTRAESLASARHALAAAGVSLVAEVASAAMDARVEAVLALVVREAITNVVRHARATRCAVRLGVEAGTVSLEIQDDGVGGSGNGGTGLAGMRVRVEELGGRFEHDGTAGTRLRVSLPASVEADAQAIAPQPGRAAESGGVTRAADRRPRAGSSEAIS